MGIPWEQKKENKKSISPSSPSHLPPKEKALSLLDALPPCLSRNFSSYIYLFVTIFLLV
jgi:hypothetical protein